MNFSSFFQWICFQTEVCSCEEEKVRSYKDPTCELNKFDDMNHGWIVWTVFGPLVFGIQGSSDIFGICRFASCCAFFRIKHWDEGFCCSGVLLYQKMFDQFLRSSRFWCQVCAFLLQGGRRLTSVGRWVDFAASKDGVPEREYIWSLAFGSRRSAFGSLTLLRFSLHVSKLALMVPHCIKLGLCVLSHLCVTMSLPWVPQPPQALPGPLCSGLRLRSAHCDRWELRRAPESGLDGDVLTNSHGWTGDVSRYSQRVSKAL